MSELRYPSLYQINTRVWLTELSRESGRAATLDDIPDADLDRLAELGFDWVWFLSVWQTGPAAQAISRENLQWRGEFEDTLPDLRDEDIAGSGFAIQSYTVHRDLGGDAALARLRQRLQARGLKLMLDFVPNHMAPDHPWIDEHPDYFVHGSETDLARSPQNYCRVQTNNGPLVLAYGRDPYFDGWPDTLQLNYGNPELQQAMIGELERIAGQCDGVRCDMAMLVLPAVFERTWGIQADLFWPKATESVRRKYPTFQFMAEVYWDHEWTMQQQGFDYAYDKRLYDRLRDRQARSGARALLGRIGLPGQAGSLPGEPRRTASSGHISAGYPCRRRCHHVPVPRTAVLPPGSIRGAVEAHLASPWSWPLRTHRSADPTVLRASLGCAARAGGAQRPVASAPVRAGLGRQLDLRLSRNVRLARPGWRATTGGGQLRTQPEPMLCPASVGRSCRQPMATAGSDEFCRVRPQRKRAANARIVSRYVALAGGSF